MFAVGHLALGYLTGKATSKLLNVDANVALLFVASIIADIDLLIPGLEHRGPTHSIIVSSILFVPPFMLYGKRAAPYFIAMVQHSIIGDVLTGGGDIQTAGGTQLFWPATLDWYGMQIAATSLTAILIEWTFFLISLTIMLKARDMWVLFQHHPTNLLLSIPVFTVLLPTFLSFPLPVPFELIIPHLVYLTIFTLSIITDIVHKDELTPAKASTDFKAKTPATWPKQLSSASITLTS